MKLTIFGARGDVGSRVVSEALSRGHEVTGIVRDPSQTHSLPTGAKARVADVSDPDKVADLMEGQDAAISALRPPDGYEQLLVPLTQSVLQASGSTSTRAIIVGGAASLTLPDGTGHTVLTAPGFLPEDVVPIARACQAQYEACAKEDRADWTYLCPPALLTPGERTGHYRTGSDSLVVDSAGNSAISMEDLAVALVDEAEAPQHSRARFTVAY